MSIIQCFLWLVAAIPILALQISRTRHVYNIQLVNSDRPLDRVCLPECLKDAGEGAAKLH